MMNDEFKPTGQDLADRTKKFAVQVIRLVAGLPNQAVGWVIGKQILRSGTSVGAQYREAMRARSTAEFISKIESALQELEETGNWLEILVDAEVVPREKTGMASRRS